MPLFIASINCKNTTQDLRASISFSNDQLNEAYSQLKSQGFQHAVILSTCNRVEIITLSQCPSARSRLHYFLSQFHDLSDLDKDQLKNSIEYFHKESALAHLIELGSGLKSMVMGEPEIFGQLKSAYFEAKSFKMTDKKLDFIFRFAFKTTKKIRHETHIGHCPVSVAFSSIKLAQKSYLLNNPNILILGAGQTAELILKHIAHLSPNKIILLNRTLSNAKDLAQKFENLNIEYNTLNQIKNYLIDSQLIIGTTASEKHLIFKEDLDNFNNNNSIQNKIFYFIDLSAYRDIDPAIKNLKNAQLISLDDIQNSISNNIKSRQIAAEKAQPFIDEAVHLYQQRKLFKDVEHDLVQFRAQIHHTKQMALEKAYKQIKAGKSPEKIVEQLANTLTNKLLHEPSSRLFQADSDQQSKLLESIKQLWG